MKVSLGKIAICPKGNYSSTEPYTKLDLVSYGGVGWLCRKDCKNIVPCDCDYWQSLGVSSENSSIIIDNILSSTSTNPVQNKIITTELNKKAVDITYVDDTLSLIDNDGNILKSVTIKQGEDIIIDDVLSETSKNPVENQVVTTELGNKAESFTYENNIFSLTGKDGKILKSQTIQSGTGTSIAVDSELSLESENAIQNKVITMEVNKKAEDFTYENNVFTLLGKNGEIIKTATIESGSSVVVDSELSDTSENTVQNKVIKNAIDSKVSSVDGMGLSHNDFTDEYKDKINKNLPLTNSDNIYVDGTNGSDSTGNGTSTTPYKSINYALSTIPKNLNGYNKYIIITGGTYNEEVNISGFYNGHLKLSRTGSGNIIVKKISITYCFGCVIYLSNFQVSNSGYVNIYHATAELSYITIDNIGYGLSGFYCRHCDVQLSSCVVSGGNGTAVLAADNGKILVSSMSGSCTGSGGTGVGFQTRTGGQICIGSSSLTATTLYKTSEGGRIYTGAQASVPNY